MTLLELIQDIQRDLGARAGNLLDTEIKRYLNQAVQDLEALNLGFNEGQATFSTVINDPDYALPAAVHLVDSVTYLSGTITYPLVPIGWDEYVARSEDTPPLPGPAGYYALRRRTMFLFPTPNEVATITIEGVTRESAVPLVNDADSNDWTTRGAEFIKSRAKSYIYAHRVKDKAQAEMMDAIADRQLEILRGDADRLVMRGEIRQVQDF